MVAIEQMYALATPDFRPYRARRPRSPWPARLGRAALVAGAVLALSFGLARAAEGGAEGAYETVTVQPGDTLWAIASQRYPGSDVRARVFDIERANHLSGGVLYPGEALLVPTR
jgi:nucleoid-associated protein YgaU